jgi:hypothetical protein
MKAFSYVAVICYVAENAYEAENNSVYRAHIKPPPNHAKYVCCRTNVIYHSINSQGGPNRVVYGWT